MSETQRDLGVTLAGRQLTLQQETSPSPRRVARFLVLVVLCLSVLSLLGQLAVHLLPDFLLRDRFAATFNVDQEGNIPSLYSALAILSCAYLLWIIAWVERETAGRFSWQWKAMSIVFIGLALDEFLAFHELLSGYADISSITRFGWVAFGAGFAFLFALTFFRMMLQLPSRVRRLFILAGLVFLSGAIGMEGLTGHFVPVWSDQGLKYVFCAATEEFLEMIGIVIFIYALLTYLVQGGREEVVLALEFRVHQDQSVKHLAADGRGVKNGPELTESTPPSAARR